MEQMASERMANPTKSPALIDVSLADGSAAILAGAVQQGINGGHFDSVCFAAPRQRADPE